VAIVLPNGPCLASAFLAAAASAAAAPLNPAYQEREFEFYLSDLRAAALIVGEDLDSPSRRVAQRMGISLIELIPSRDEAGIFTLREISRARGGKSRAPSSAPPASLLLHTSGTTSRPKLVSLTQANLLASATNVARSLQLRASDRCLNVMPLFHIHGLVGATLSTLVSGGAVFCTEGPAFPSFFDWLHERSSTWYTAVPTIHQAILAAAKKISPIQHRLRLIRSSSAALAPPTLEALESLFGVPVIEAYGMTEAAHQMASNPLPPDRRKAGSVGRAAGPRIGIMSEKGDLLAASAQGEVVIQGPNVMAGYEGNAEANRASFVGKWFRTGDLGFLDEEGYLFLVGRIKEQVNRGGEKVSPKEVDEALLAHPAIALATAFGMPHPTLGEDVAAAVVLREGASTSESDVRTFLAGRLAAFKVPQRILFVKEIPKGPTGKVQRIGLHEKFKQELTTGFVEPSGEMELLIARVWKDTLGIDRVGAHDNFFSLGGDSLHGMRTIVKAREAGLLITPQMIFQYPTVSQLASLAKRIPGKETTVPAGVSLEGGSPSFPELTPDRRDGLARRFPDFEKFYPILPGQLDLCPVSRPSDQPCLSWHGQLELALGGNVRLEVFKQALERAAESHEATRAALDWDRDPPLGVVCPPRPLLWDRSDWKGSASGLVEQALSNIRSRDLAEGFVPARPPHFRVAALETDTGVRLLLSHWIPALDSWSILSLLAEALATYRARAGGGPAPLVPRDSFHEYVESRYRASEVPPRSSHAEPAKKWGRRLLSALGGGNRSTSVRLTLSSEESQSVRDWARGNRFHLNAVLQGIFSLGLERRFEGSGLIMLNTVSGRFDAFPGIESVIGSTFELFPICIPPEKGGSPVSRIALVQQMLQTERRENAGVTRPEAMPIWHYDSLPDLRIVTDPEVHGVKSRLFVENAWLQISVTPDSEIDIRLDGHLEQPIAEELLHRFRETLSELVKPRSR
jgi:acyl-CoA synthetase (AMP-forming)/AMP-acid ligase II